LVLTGCTIQENHADALSGAIHSSNVGRITLDHCLFGGNFANQRGGVMYVSGTCKSGLPK